MAQITTAQQLPLTATPVDAVGQPIPGATFAQIVWAVSDVNVLAVTQDAAGVEYAIPLAVGAADVTVTAVTSDGQTFTDILRVEVVPAPAPPIADVRIVAGDPVAQPAA